MSAHAQRTSTSWARPMRGAETRTPPADTQSPGTLKVHKNENFFGSDFEFCTISLLVMLKY